jgi:hypothetical protein
MRVSPRPFALALDGFTSLLALVRIYDIELYDPLFSQMQQKIEQIHE